MKVADDAETVDPEVKKAFQKFGAQKTLLDLMLQIDPEFTELEEYAWAKELLESTMIEPNGKPQTIVDQL